MSAVTIVAVPIQIARFRLKIRAPGIVRHLAFEKQSQLVMRNGAPDFTYVPVMFVEGQRDAPIEEHEFGCFEHGTYLDLGEGEEAVWRATGLAMDGRIVHLYEIKPARSRALS